MPKKSSSETPVKMQENQIEKQEKTTPKSKKPRNVIEEIFAEKKRKRSEEEEKSEKQKKDADLKAKKMKKKKKKNDEDKEGGFVNQSSRSRKKMGDGLVIYTEEELGFGKADAGENDDKWRQHQVLLGLFSQMKIFGSSLRNLNNNSLLSCPRTSIYLIVATYPRDIDKPSLVSFSDPTDRRSCTLGGSYSEEEPS